MKSFVLLNLLFIILSAPWFFLGSKPDSEIANLPTWAIYCCVIAVLYAVFIAISLNRLWNRIAQDPEADE